MVTIEALSVPRSAAAAKSRTGVLLPSGSDAPSVPATGQATFEEGFLRHGPTGGPRWQVSIRGSQPGMASSLAVSNGCLGIVGPAVHTGLEARPQAFVAGLFDRLPSSTPMPVLVSTPDWLALDIRVDGHPIQPPFGTSPRNVHVLDMRNGMLWQQWREKSQRGRGVDVRALCFASQVDRSLGVQVIRVAVDGPARVTLGASLPVQEGLVPEVTAALVRTLWQTRPSGRRLAVATRYLASTRGAGPVTLTAGPWGRYRCAWDAAGDRGSVLTLVRYVSLFRDGDADPAEAAGIAVERAATSGLASVVSEHTRAWARRWDASDIEVEGDDRAQLALRLAGYHLISAADPCDGRVSIGARALTGQAYNGHVFWDTEIFLLPFFTLTWPAAARSLLMYRYRTLPAARARAALHGCRGALYAWESADSGQEATPALVTGTNGEPIQIHNGTNEIHISADVAFGVWQYWQASADDEFLQEAGAEILIETARFWATRAEREADGRYHIRRVIGPDEYHELVDDNAYTNLIARWNLGRAAEVTRLLRSRWPAEWSALERRLGVTAAEIRRWRRVAAGLVAGRDATTGLVEQFAGFFGLEPVDVAAYSPRAVPMDVILGRERTQHSQVIKQADVLMALALLPDEFPGDAGEANFRYYEPLCGHGSSLSPAIHALVAARLGHDDLALRYFHQAASIDLDDAMRNEDGGVHMANLGGLWQAVVFGFAGLTLGSQGLAFHPKLPATWKSIRFPLQWHGRHLRVSIEKDPYRFEARLDYGEPMAIVVGEETCRLDPHRGWIRWLEEEGCWILDSMPLKN